MSPAFALPNHQSFTTPSQITKTQISSINTTTDQRPKTSIDTRSILQLQHSFRFSLVHRMSFRCSAETNGLIVRLFELNRNSNPNRLTEMRSILETNRHIQLPYTSPLYAILEGGSVDFCKLIIELNPELVTTPTTNRLLPIHIDIIQLLLELYPESINLQQYPIHAYLEGSGDPKPEVLLCLLNYDQGAVRTPDDFGNLPLHKVIGMCDTSVVDAVQLVFDAYPQAVYIYRILGVRHPWILQKNLANQTIMFIWIGYCHNFYLSFRLEK